MHYNPEIETMPLEKLRTLQSERLVNMIARLYENVPFYRELFKKEGIKPGDVKGIEDIHRLPFTKKEDLRDNYPFGLFARPMDEVSRIHASSGTTGNPQL